MTIDTLENICRDYHKRIERLEDEKYDLEYIVKGKDYQVHIEMQAKFSRQSYETQSYFFSFNSKSSFSNFILNINLQLINVSFFNNT